MSRRKASPKASPAGRSSDAPKAWGPDAPMAVAGLTSYRYRGRFGWVMIGARDNADALRQAARSIDGEPQLDCLEVWSSGGYVRVKP